MPEVLKIFFFWLRCINIGPGNHGCLFEFWWSKLRFRYVAMLKVVSSANIVFLLLMNQNLSVSFNVWSRNNTNLGWPSDCRQNSRRNGWCRSTCERIFLASFPPGKFLFVEYSWNVPMIYSQNIPKTFPMKFWEIPRNNIPGTLNIGILPECHKHFF